MTPTPVPEEAPGGPVQPAPAAPPSRLDALRDAILWQASVILALTIHGSTVWLDRVLLGQAD